MRQSWHGGPLCSWKVFLFGALVEDSRSWDSLLSGKLCPHSPCLNLQMIPLKTREAHGTQNPQQLCCAHCALYANFHPQPSFCRLAWVLVRARQTPSLPPPPFPHGAFLLQPPQGSGFCPSIVALSYVPRSEATRRARLSPSHNSAGLIQLP